MTFEHEWTPDNNLRIYWDGEELTAEPIDNPTNGKSRRDGVPVGVREWVANWMADQDIPNDLGYANAIMMCISLEAGRFEERMVE